MMPLYPLETLQQYERFTALLWPKDTNKSFMAIKKPFKPVDLCTDARWSKEISHNMFHLEQFKCDWVWENLSYSHKTTRYTFTITLYCTH